jgi:hypothetical protein
MVLLALILGALATETTPFVTVDAAGDCPSAAAVGAKLNELMPTGDPPRAPDVAEVRVVGTTLTISLRRASGEAVGQKELPAPAGCAARAAAAAVVLAAWQTELAGHAAAALTLPVTPPPLPEPAAAPPAPAPPPPATPAPVVATVTRTPAAAVAPPSGEKRSLVLDPGASVLASIDADDTAVAATAELALARDGSPFALAAGALFVSAHTTAVSPGIGSWRRFGVSADGRRRLHRGGFWLEARLGLALTVLDISGSALTRDGGGTVLDPGALAGLRVGLPGGPATPWLEIATTFWPRRQTLEVQGGAATDLPRFEALLGVGLSFGRRP